MRPFEKFNGGVFSILHLTFIDLSIARFLKKEGNVLKYLFDSYKIAKK
jgi:hypothetical protein